MKKVLIIILIILIIALAWWSYMYVFGGSLSQAPATDQTAQQTQIPVATSTDDTATTSTSGAVTQQVSATQQVDTSDAGLNNALGDIDSQMSGLQSDSANSDTSGQQ